MSLHAPKNNGPGRDRNDRRHSERPVMHGRNQPGAVSPTRTVPATCAAVRRLRSLSVTGLLASLRRRLLQSLRLATDHMPPRPRSCRTRGARPCRRQISEFSEPGPSGQHEGLSAVKPKCGIRHVGRDRYVILEWCAPCSGI